jgi:hypothetical protein
MATSVHPRPLAGAATSRAVASIAYAAVGVLLAAVAAVHVQQFADLFYGVSWIGPLFIALAAGCVLVIAALVYPDAPARCVSWRGGLSPRAGRTCRELWPGAVRLAGGGFPDQSPWPSGQRFWPSSLSPSA